MRFLMWFILFVVYSCGTEEKKHSTNPKAIKLLDSAIYIVKDYHDYPKAIALIDQAIYIDSNYFAAHSTKFAFQGLSKPIDINKMLPTLIKLIELKPFFPEYHLYAGIIYLKKGDSITAQKYLTEAEIQCNKFLTTMRESTSAYNILLGHKALSLILQGQEKQGDEILSKIFNQEKDSVYKRNIKSIIVKSRQEIIDSLISEK